jgi:hypothetical protein
LGCLGLPWWRSRRVHAIADTSYNATHDHMGNAVCRTLQDSADAHDCRSDEDGLLATEVISEYEGADGSKKAADVVDGLRSKRSNQLSVP